MACATPHNFTSLAGVIYAVAETMCGGKSNLELMIDQGAVWTYESDGRTMYVIPSEQVSLKETNATQNKYTRTKAISQSTYREFNSELGMLEWDFSKGLAAKGVQNNDKPIKSYEDLETP
eukprot:5939312-Alexandrium_andersonii.AAC.1